MRKLIGIMACALIFALIFGTNISLSYRPPTEVSRGFLRDQYDLVIIAPSMFSPALQPLVNHKNNHSVPTIFIFYPNIYQFDQILGHNNYIRKNL